MRTIRNAPFPEVRPVGANPDDWDSDYPDYREMKPGDKFAMQLMSEKESVRWIREDPVLEDAFYAVTGNFNDWQEDRMVRADDVGDVGGCGLHVVTVLMPVSGRIEFRILKNGEDDAVIAPATPACTRKTTPILGPGPDLKNYWLVEGSPGQEVVIELFISDELRSVLWIKR